jgi:hypothetical protein
MGAKRRIAITARQPLTRDILDRYEVVNPISFAEWKFAQQREQEKRQKAKAKAAKKEAA